MIVSRIAADARVEVPDAVLRALKLKPDDGLAFHVDGDQVVVRRVAPDVAAEALGDIDEETGLPFATLNAMVDEALNDPSPPVPIEEAFAQLREFAAEYRRKHG